MTTATYTPAELTGMAQIAREQYAAGMPGWYATPAAPWKVAIDDHGDVNLVVSVRVRPRNGHTYSTKQLFTALTPRRVDRELQGP